MRTFLFVLTFFLGFSTTAFPQHATHNTSKEQPATHVAGMGSHHHAVSTTNPEAQKFFDQGMRFVFAFNHDEAIRSFKRAAELDPQLAMAHWGIALALGPNINLDVDPEREKAAYEAAQKAHSHRLGLFALHNRRERFDTGPTNSPLLSPYWLSFVWLGVISWIVCGESSAHDPRNYTKTHETKLALGIHSRRVRTARALLSKDPPKSEISYPVVTYAGWVAIQGGWVVGYAGWVVGYAGWVDG